MDSPQKKHMLIRFSVHFGSIFIRLLDFRGGFEILDGFDYSFKDYRLSVAEEPDANPCEHASSSDLGFNLIKVGSLPRIFRTCRTVNFEMNLFLS